jgi:UDP-GlcNAc:undecaprenyl-phosphate GlcNAc-1-phosphate transferase
MALVALLGLGGSMVIIWSILGAYRRFKFSGREEFHHGHGIPVPRLGGVALAASFIGILILSATIWPGCLDNQQMRKVAFFSMLMFGLGLWDDISALGARRKLLGQLLIAAAACYSGIGIYRFQIPFTHNLIDLGAWSGVVTVFWLVALTNLINLIDGTDGLAGGICLMLMLLMAYVGGAAEGMTLVTAGMVGVLLGFLRFNFPPARIYMGDGGAYFLGFLIGCLTIVSSHKGTVFAALTAPLFVLALPILDTTLAILRRGLRGLPLFRADRKHLHHRLLDAGLSRRQVVLVFYVFTAFFFLLGFVAFWMKGQHLELLLGIGALVVIIAAGKFSFSREWFAVGRVLGNSLSTRADIQYTLAQSRWLALEGGRSQSLNELCEDVVFIARKLGFASLRIRLEDDEKVWKWATMDEKNSYRFQHKLPGHRYCFLELAADSALPNKATLKILSDLVAEAWAKAVHVWKTKHQLQPRFDARKGSPAGEMPNPMSTLQTETVTARIEPVFE